MSRRAVLRMQSKLLLLPVLLALSKSSAFVSLAVPPQAVVPAAASGRLPRHTSSYRPRCSFRRLQKERYPRLRSSRSGDTRDDDAQDDDETGLGKFLDPNYRESENLQRAREYISENSLPITADMGPVVNDDNDMKGDTVELGESEIAAQDVVSAPTDARESTALSANVSVVPPNSTSSTLELTNQGLERNPYMAVISRLSPSELISRFTSTAHPRVQSAVRQTILGMLGGLPKLAFETTTFTTAQRLASLMFQLQMTGYMFKNAEYLLSLRQSLGDYSNSQYLLSGDDDAVDVVDPRTTKIRGRLRIPLMDPGSGDAVSGSSNAANRTIPALEVDAAAYMGELRQEVAQLRRELETARQAKEEALRKDLLLYIRTLPEQELRSLTNTMSSDVLVAMKGLVNAVLAGIGEEAQEPITPQTITEQSGEAMAQLCMWQLAIGYNLRTLEVREEIKKSVAGSAAWSENQTEGNGSSSATFGAFE